MHLLDLRPSYRWVVLTARPQFRRLACSRGECNLIAFRVRWGCLSICLTNSAEDWSHHRPILCCLLLALYSKTVIRLCMCTLGLVVSSCCEWKFALAAPVSGCQLPHFMPRSLHVIIARNDERTPEGAGCYSVAVELHRWLHAATP
jgi:hypothetical protein